MPIKSKAQQRLLFAKERAGELPKGTALKMARETKEKGVDLKDFLRRYPRRLLPSSTPSSRRPPSGLTRPLPRLAYSAYALSPG